MYNAKDIYLHPNMYPISLEKHFNQLKTIKPAPKRKKWIRFHIRNLVSPFTQVVLLKGLLQNSEHENVIYENISVYDNVFLNNHNFIIKYNELMSISIATRNYGDSSDYRGFDFGILQSSIFLWTVI